MGRVLCFICLCVTASVITIVAIVLIHRSTDDNNDEDGDGAEEAWFWMMMVHPIYWGFVALYYSGTAVHLVWNIAKHGVQGYDLWWRCVFVFAAWIYFWKTWTVTRPLAIGCALLLLISCYLFLQQISHRIMTGLSKEDYIQKHCANEPKQRMLRALKQLVLPPFVK